VRRYDEAVEVRVDGGASGREEPSAFLWRGRLYVVREVLGHWKERRAWWGGASARALHGTAETLGAGSAGGTAVAEAPPRSPTAADAVEHEVWRVEARAGRSGVAGVYDLRRRVRPAPAAGPTGAADGAADVWQLARVTD